MAVSPTLILHQERPRNVNTFQAAAILYGDWGTSKAYVIGLAFALAAYSSFWLIALVSVLNIMVGLNYIVVCRCYPDGGGVYASVRHRSEALALIGGFFLIADYIITASLSALSAYQYLAVPFPEHWALISIVIIGALNWFGPRHSGNAAFLFSLPVLVVVFILGGLSLFHMDEAIHHVQPLESNLATSWSSFVGIIVGLSGVESIANATGVMKRDPDSKPSRPTVSKTATPAIITVMLEVSIFTTLLGLAANALPGLVAENGEVNAPGYPNVRDSMLRYMGEVFGSDVAGAQAGYIFGWIVSIVFCALLLSAVNTAIVALVSLLFVMSNDGELPKVFQRLNQFGVPKVPLLIATLIPAVVLVIVHDIAGLAHLYAIGFVGAIATNLGSTSTDQKLNLTWKTRFFMFITFIIMAAIEVTLFIEKPNARNFALAVLAVGLFLRFVSKKPSVKKHRPPPVYPIVPDLAHALSMRIQEVEKQQKTVSMSYRGGPILCALTQMGKSLEFAFTESVQHGQHLYILFLRQQKIIMETPNVMASWVDDDEARQIMDYAKKQHKGKSFTFLYLVSESPALNIAKMATELKAKKIILDVYTHNKLHSILYGKIVKELKGLLPADVDIVEIF